MSGRAKKKEVRVRFNNVSKREKEKKEKNRRSEVHYPWDSWALPAGRVEMLGGTKFGKNPGKVKK